MKRNAVRMKITLWYALIILLLMVGPLTALVFTAEKVSWNRAEGNLKESLHDFMEEVDIHADGYETEEDTEYYDDGVSFSIYDEGGKLREGNVPVHFPEDTVLKSGEVQSVSSVDRKWITYDEAYRTEGQIIWFRAVASAGDLSMMGQVLLTLVLIVTPVLAVLAIVGGYVITGRTLKPVEEALERERVFTADVSHELRTPVSVITSESEFALMPETSKAEMQESLSVILKQVGRMSDLIEQLLVLSRGEAGEQKLQMKEVDMSVLAQLTAEEMGEKAEAEDIRIVTDISPGLKVRGSEEMLIRLFINLLENSIRYGKKGGTARVSLTGDGNFVKGCVEDDGCGIKKEDLPHIWERFYQADAVRTKDGRRGFGLGLPMVQWIVKVHRGRIQAESRLDEGTRFTFWLPVSESGR
ncbi:sensor histidine kinase [Clostridium sp. AF15-17LB]|nr:sensor histidine kinase [Clostridium sp. AF15-17LB]